MRSFALVTVQHTGTISLRSLFFDLGYKRLRGVERHMVDPTKGNKWALNKRFAEKHVINWHPYARGTEHLRKLDAPIVTTTRNIDDMKASWTRRYGGLDNKRMSLERQLELWEKHVLPFADVVVPIEYPATALAELERLLDVKLPRELPHLNKGGHGNIVTKTEAL